MLCLLENDNNTLDRGTVNQITYTIVTTEHQPQKPFFGRDVCLASFSFLSFQDQNPSACLCF